jgi:hypothetical protein
MGLRRGAIRGYRNGTGGTDFGNGWARRLLIPYPILTKSETMKKIAMAIVVAVTAFSAAAPAFAYYHHDRYYHHCHRVWHHHHWERVCR